MKASYVSLYLCGSNFSKISLLMISPTAPPPDGTGGSGSAERCELHGPWHWLWQFGSQQYSGVLPQYPHILQQRSPGQSLPPACDPHCWAWLPSKVAIHAKTKSAKLVKAAPFIFLDSLELVVRTLVLTSGDLYRLDKLMSTSIQHMYYTTCSTCSTRSPYDL